MKNLTLTLMVLILSCEQDNVFKDLVNEEKVFIVLDKYGLESIPKDIGDLKEVKELEIYRENTEGWKVYPPLSVLQQGIETPPYQTIPNELLNLQNLKKLTLSGLDIRVLPDNMDKLKELEYLDLSMNKLTVINEIPKLKKIPKLKYIELFGNRINHMEIEKWRNENPNIKISYREE